MESFGKLARRAGRAKSFFRPRLELLEDRTVPTLAYGLTTNGFLLQFDTAAPTNVLHSSQITGLATGETIVDIDFRPATGQLIGVAVANLSAAANDSTGVLYQLDPLSGVASKLGTGLFSTTLTDDANWGIDFDPASGKIRLVNNADDNLRVDPGTYALNTDTNLTAGVTSIAYDQNFTGTPTTTLFGINPTTNKLVRIGDVNGTPNSANNGVLTNIGAGLGVTTANGDIGFDIKVNFKDGTSSAFAALTDNGDGFTKLYKIDLTTGVATQVGVDSAHSLIGNGASVVTGLALVPDSFQVFGAEKNSTPTVKVLLNGTQEFFFNAYPTSYRGGVRVTTGDVNRDGVPDIIVGTGSAGGNYVKVFNGASAGLTPTLIHQFNALNPLTYKGGVYVASGDFNADGFDDIVVGAGPGPTALVNVFDGQDAAAQTTTVLKSLVPFNVGFHGGVRVAVGDVNGDGTPDIIAGSGAGAAGRVQAFNFANLAVLQDFFPFGTAFTGGLFVAAGDIDGDGIAEILVGAGAQPVLKTFSTVGGITETHNLLVYDATFKGGLRVATVDANGDGKLDILTGAGPTGKRKARLLDGVSLTEINSFYPFTLSYTAGFYVAGG